MPNVLADLSWSGFALSAVVSVVLAGVWFAGVVAKPYLVALGRADQPAPPNDLLRNVGPVVCTVVVTFTITALVEALDINDVGGAIAFGLAVGVGLLTAMTFQIALNPNFPRPLLYGVLNAPYFVLSAVATSVIVTLMR